MVFVLANSADPDEMPHNATFHLGLHCLSKYLLRGSGPERVKSLLFLFLTTSLPFTVQSLYYAMFGLHRNGPYYK